MTGVTKRRREKPDVRRSQILEAAKTCFRSLGFQASTVDRIAAEAGVSVGLLYRHFTSKSGMIEAIILENLEAQLDQAGEVLERASGDPSAIARLITAEAVQAGFKRDQLALMFEIAAEVCRNPKLQKFLQKRRMELRQDLARRLAAKGLDGNQALALTDTLDLASSIASGMAIHAMLYSDAAKPLEAEPLLRSVNAALFPSNHD